LPDANIAVTHPQTYLPFCLYTFRLTFIGFRFDLDLCLCAYEPHWFRPLFILWGKVMRKEMVC
jgi:hypothetical protein